MRPSQGMLTAVCHDAQMAELFQVDKIPESIAIPKTIETYLMYLLDLFLF